MNADEKRLYAQSFPVHVGVDTAKTFHVLVARGPDGVRSKPHRVLVSRAGFEACDAHLRGLYPHVEPSHMLIGLEFAGHHGFTFARFLALERGYQVVNVLAAHTKRAKELEDNSPLKSDPKDAAVTCMLLGTGTFVRFPFLKHPYVELRLLTTHRWRLTVEITRYKNRLQGLLDLAWPEFLGQFSKLTKKTPRAILERWPLPQDLLAASPRSVRAQIRASSRGHIGGERIDALLQSARETIGLPEAADERRLEITCLLQRWQLAEHQMDDLDARIAALVEQCAEGRALLTLPEISAVCAATILAELGTPEDFQHYRQILKLAGMNLVGRSSGQLDQSRAMKWQSKRGRPMLRRQLFLLAGRWCQERGLYRADYLALRGRNGGLRTHAIASIARKLVPLVWAILKTKEPFDLDRWLAQRHRREVA